MSAHITYSLEDFEVKAPKSSILPRLVDALAATGQSSNYGVLDLRLPRLGNRHPIHFFEQKAARKFAAWFLKVCPHYPLVLRPSSRGACLLLFATLKSTKIVGAERGVYVRADEAEVMAATDRIILAVEEKATSLGYSHDAQTRVLTLASDIFASIAQNGFFWGFGEDIRHSKEIEYLSPQDV